VLVVDDEPLIRWSLAELFTDVGYDVAEASDGASALMQVSDGEAFDAIVLDYRLPDSNDLLRSSRSASCSHRRRSS
jgi:CheY-like chemotaxis protein